MRPIKNHHYVPRHYLKGFTEFTGSSSIWVYEKGSQRVFRTGVQAVAFEKGFYAVENNDGTRDTNTVETYLAKHIEGPANPILDKIRASHRITVEEKRIFSLYLCVMLKRIPAHRDRLCAVAPQVIASLTEQIRSGGVRELPTEEHRSAALSILQEYGSELPKKFMIPTVSPRIAEALCGMTWQFLTCKGEPKFVTCDNPVFFFEGIGISNPYSEVTFPVSKDTALWATWRTDLKEGFFQATQKAIEEINRRSVIFASRYVFHCENAPWVTARNNGEEHEFNRLV